MEARSKVCALSTRSTGSFISSSEMGQQKSSGSSREEGAFKKPSVAVAAGCGCVLLRGGLWLGKKGAARAAAAAHDVLLEYKIGKAAFAAAAATAAECTAAAVLAWAVAAAAAAIASGVAGPGRDGGATSEPTDGVP
mmetsp:Transcript_42018/g.103613  ORF Transcript_42018/g.103613 Transcript_42018/m.103613 type:complete len:137 (-) Transcript_42018:2146-2556(-)